MQIDAKMYRGTLYLTLCGELDESCASVVKNNLDEQMSMNDFRQIIIDLSHLDFMDSTGIGVLIGRYKKMQQKGIPIYISNPSKQADKIFRMSALYDIMPKIN